MEMEEVAGGGTADRDVVDMGVVIINAHLLRTLDAPKVVATLAEDAVGEGFHRPQECFIHGHQPLCHLIHGT